MVLFVLVSALNQLVRRVNPHGKPFESVEERNSPVTAALAEQMREARRWKWTKILVYAHYWIIAVVSLVVLAGTFTVVVLSWVRVQLYGADLGTIYAMFYVVGIAMFLNPFIPGLPVYLTGGILLTGPRFQDAFGGDARYPGSYAAALACAIAFCFFLKLSAAFMQQKLIGEPDVFWAIAARTAVQRNAWLAKAKATILRVVKAQGAKYYYSKGEATTHLPTSSLPFSHSFPRIPTTTITCTATIGETGKNSPIAKVALNIKVTQQEMLKRRRNPAASE